MAKLIAIVSRAVWLVVALAAIAGSTQAGGFFTSSSEDKGPRERNDNDWKKLGMACANRIEKFESHMDMIKFLSELKVVSKETDCSVEMRDRIAAYLYITEGTDSINGRRIGTKERYAKCFKLMKEYLALYLDECGYEESFRKAAVFIEGKSHERFSFTQHKTLKSYIDETYFVLKENILSLRALLATIEYIPKLEQISVETDCTEELTTDMINSFVVNNVRGNYVPGELNKVNFALYLDKCGYEKLHNERIEHTKQVSDEHWNSDEYPTLYSYFAAILSKNKSKYETVLITWLTKILSMMRELPALESISNETLCTDEPKDTLLADLKFTSSEAPLLYDLYEDYFTLYSNKCGVDKLPNN